MAQAIQAKWTDENEDKWCAGAGPAVWVRTEARGSVLVCDGGHEQGACCFLVAGPDATGPLLRRVRVLLARITDTEGPNYPCQDPTKLASELAKELSGW